MLWAQKGNEKEETNAASSMPQHHSEEKHGNVGKKRLFLYRKAPFFLVRSVEQGWMRSERRRKEAFSFLAQSSKEELLVLLMVGRAIGRGKRLASCGELENALGSLIFDCLSLHQCIYNSDFWFTFSVFTKPVAMNGSGQPFL